MSKMACLSPQLLRLAVIDSSCHNGQLIVLHHCLFHCKPSPPTPPPPSASFAHAHALQETRGGQERPGNSFDRQAAAATATATAARRRKRIESQEAAGRKRRGNRPEGFAGEREEGADVSGLRAKEPRTTGECRPFLALIFRRARGRGRERGDGPRAMPILIVGSWRGVFPLSFSLFLSLSLLLSLSLHKCPLSLSSSLMCAYPPAHHFVLPLSISFSLRCSSAQPFPCHYPYFTSLPIQIQCRSPVLDLPDPLLGAPRPFLSGTRVRRQP